MKICYFGDGESIHTNRWCRHFASLGYDVHLISFKNVVIDNVTTHFIESGRIDVTGGNWKLLFKFRKVRAILKKVQPNILHSLYATSYGITGALCNYHPYIISALGSDVLISPQKSIIYRIFLKYAFSKADWITVMSDHMKSLVQKMGISISKIETIPFGIDPKIFNETNRKLPVDKFIITSTRNFEEVYNIEHLINSVAIAKRIIPQIHLNLIGSGSMKNKIENLVEKKGLKSSVTFYGKVPQAKIAEVLKQSHVFISVSKSDGNNISLNEAMATGTFCIATNIPANSQWIVKGENGFLVEINDVDELSDKIISSFNNYDTLQEKSVPINLTIIRERAIWENNMRDVEQKYKSLIKK